MNVLLAIKPKYVDEIIKGNKKYEFRKAIFKQLDDVEFVYIYSSAPVKKIVGYFVIEKIISDSPSIIWKKCHKFSGISEKGFFDYFAKKELGHAIKIGKFKLFDVSIEPKRVLPNFVPPQSFCYVDQMITC
jgi:predicted transcriptional regulator